MKTLVAFMAFASVLLGSSSAALAAQSVPVSVTEGDQQFLGNLYLPDNAKGALPLVLVIHEWWGKTEYPKMRAERIANELGYAALAVDLYGNGKTVDNPKDAGALATPFYQNPAMAVGRLKSFIAAAPEAAKTLSASIDPKKISAIGYCFGGSQALNLARDSKLEGGKVLVGAVSFHGGLASSLKAKGRVKPKLLVLHGGSDPMVKPEEAAAFKKEMKAAKADLKFVTYQEATHAFTNPKATENGKKFGIPIAYNERADRESWEEMKTFFKKLYR